MITTKRLQFDCWLMARFKVCIFELNMQEIAKKNSVFGWVRNLTDGRVEALLEGNKDGVDKVIEWSKKGPDNARVDDLKIDYLQYEGKFVDFVIQHDES